MGFRTITILPLFLFIYQLATAQLCQGSLGDPIVNITFGSGSNPGSPLAAATTSYQYTTSSCPGDGYYTVVSSGEGCFTSTWHAFASDHTGNGNGYLMLINASYDPSAFYLDTVRNLCTGTTYEFAAWVINVLKSSACGGTGIQPNLTFTIEKTDGTVLQSYNTGNIPAQASPLWKQYGFFFSTPPGVSDIVLRIFNNSPGGCGNDLALDDITFRPCGPQLTVSVTGVGTNDIALCEGDARSFTMNGSLSAGFNNPSVQWQQSINGGAWTDIPGATSTGYFQNFLSNTPPGVYSFRLSAAEAGNMGTAKCRVSSQKITITIFANPDAGISSNSPVCAESTLTLTGSGGVSYQWSGPGALTATSTTVTLPNAQPAQGGKYYLMVTDANGCKDIDSTIAVVNSNPVASTTFNTASLCAGEQVQLIASGGTTYTWFPSTGLSSGNIPDPFASPADTILYHVSVKNASGCADTATINVNVIEKPLADAGPDRYIVGTNSVRLAGTASGQNIHYEWTPALYIDDVSALQPLVSPPADQVYRLRVTSGEGCGVAEDSVKIYVFRDIFVPGAFSPNNDGLNDTWSIPALKAFNEYTVAVYNRSGQILFRCQNTMTPWNGRFRGELQPMGVYVYRIEIKDTGRQLKGTLTIVR